MGIPIMTTFNAFPYPIQKKGQRGLRNPAAATSQQIGGPDQQDSPLQPTPLGEKWTGSAGPTGIDGDLTDNR